MCPSGPVAFEARFRGPDRLLHSRDFQRVTRTGQRHASRYFVLLVTPRNSPGSNRPRLGITASRRVGNAVVRNRIKRLIREWFRSNRSILPAADLVVIARQPAATLSGPEIRDELTRLASEPS